MHRIHLLQPSDVGEVISDGSVESLVCVVVAKLTPYVALPKVNGTGRSLPVEYLLKCLAKCMQIVAYEYCRHASCPLRGSLEEIGSIILHLVWRLSIVIGAGTSPMDSRSARMILQGDTPVECNTSTSSIAIAG